MTQIEHRPSWALRRPSGRTVVAVATVGLAIALVLRTLFRYGGPPMEEGFMLVFPEQILHGRMPHRDFLHLYGPGSLWALAGWFKVWGVGLDAERIFGLGQILAIIGGVMALVRPWGRWAVVAAGLTAVLFTTTPAGLAALAWQGAVGLALVSCWAGLRGRRWLTDAPDADGEVTERLGARWLTAAGVLAGLCLLFRPDAIIAMGLATMALLSGLGWTRWKRWLLGAIPVLSLYVVHLALSGPGDAIRGMFIEPVFDLRAGRSLPRPPSHTGYDGALQGVGRFLHPPWWGPSLSTPMQIFTWFFLVPAVVAFNLAVAIWVVRSDRSSWRGRVLLVIGLLGLGLLPQAMQRPDTTHFAWVSSVPLAFLPAVIAELAVRQRWARLRRHAGPVAAALTVLLPLLVIPHFTGRTYVDLVRQGLPGHQVFGTPVDHDGRRFILGDAGVAPPAQRLVDDLGRMAKPGQRLFVGPVDLRKTPYSDAYLYYLLPDLVPATRYIEMDPGVANGADSGLADEVASADWLILSHVWDPWHEPNASRDFGPDQPNQVVRRDFCLVDDYTRPGQNGDPPQSVFLLYRHCR